MKTLPNVRTFEDGSKMWEESFEEFTVKVYIPVSELPKDIVNFGFRAPYLIPESVKLSYFFTGTA